MALKGAPKENLSAVLSALLKRRTFLNFGKCR
jgi:hypothetical protein